MARFGADTATCEVFTLREGVLAAAGHDLKLRPERFEIEADAGSVRARFEAGSLRARTDPASASISNRSGRSFRSCPAAASTPSRSVNTSHVAVSAPKRAIAPQPIRPGA